MLSTLVLVGLVAVASGHSHEHGDSHSHSHGDMGDSDVVVLNGATFDDEIAAHGLVLVEFYAPWCGHCKSLAPEFETAATQLIGNSLLAKVDCTTEDNKALCSKYGVQGFPTLTLFSDGTPSDYEGARKADAMVSFMKRQSMPPFTELANAEEVEAFKTKGISIVLTAVEGPELDAFKAAAKAMSNEDVEFGIFTAEGAASVTFYKTFDEPETTFAGDLTNAAAIQAFVQAESFPLVDAIGPENYKKYVDRNLPLVWIFTDPASQVLVEEAREIAKDFKGQFSFVHLDGEQWADHAQGFGLKSSTPGVVIEQREGNKKYTMNDVEVNAETLRAHVTAVASGSVEPTVKSEAIPEPNDSPVTIVVGKNFDAVVMDLEKDVLVEFYAPWCGHCKSLEPKWDALGELFKDNANVVIAKCDSTANDTPAPIEGFPTLIFYPATDKTPIDYDGARETKELHDWVVANGKSTAAAVAAPAAGHDEL